MCTLMKELKVNCGDLLVLSDSLLRKGWFWGSELMGQQQVQINVTSFAGTKLLVNTDPLVGTEDASGSHNML